jgi:hypothetical protein
VQKLVQNHRVTDTDVIALIKVNKSLVSISGVVHNTGEITASTFYDFILTNRPDIDTLDLYHTGVHESLAHVSFMELVAQCGKLVKAKHNGDGLTIEFGADQKCSRNVQETKCLTIRSDQYFMDNTTDASRQAKVETEISTLKSALIRQIFSVQSVVLSAYYHHRKDILCSIAACFVNLQTFYLRPTVLNKSRAFIYNNFSEGLRTILTACIHLTSLTIELNRQRVNGLTNSELPSLIPLMCNLKHLNLKDHDDMTTKTVIAIIKGCPNLLSFPVINTRNINILIDRNVIESFVKAHPEYAKLEWMESDSQ